MNSTKRFSQLLFSAIGTSDACGYRANAKFVGAAPDRTYSSAEAASRDRSASGDDWLTERTRSSSDAAPSRTYSSAESASRGRPEKHLEAFWTSPGICRTGRGIQWCSAYSCPLPARAACSTLSLSASLSTKRSLRSCSSPAAASGGE